MSRRIALIAERGLQTRAGAAGACMRIVMAVLACLLLTPHEAHAQSAPPPATYYQFDERGVDLTSGAYHVATPSVAIGDPGMGGLVYQRRFDSSISDWRDNVTGTINSSGGTYTVTLMGQSEA